MICRVGQKSNNRYWGCRVPPMHACAVLIGAVSGGTEEIYNIQVGWRGVRCFVNESGGFTYGKAEISNY